MGPAVESPEKVAELIAAGMNMARLNLSHGGYDEHQNRLDLVRNAAAAANRPVAILVDLQGPKIRLARFKDGPHELARGDISPSQQMKLKELKRSAELPIRVWQETVSQEIAF